MEATLSTSLIPTSEIDTVMSDMDHPNNTSNGFIDPRDTVLNHPPEPELATSTAEEYSRNRSPATATTAAVVGRKHFAPTGCCYDDRMKFHANADFSDNPHHPEDPRRIEAIMREFKDAGLIYNGPESELESLLKESPNRWMYRVAARCATEKEICLVHTHSHFEWVKALHDQSSSTLRSMTMEMDAGRRSLYVGNLTYDAALISAGGAIETCKNVVAGNCKNAIAVIRPPGHHAEHNESMGFCIFNNVPIAASVCMQDYPEACRKVLIVDWDVHHGNGIQNMFYENPNVLYISLHVYQDGNFYPGQPPDGGTDGGLDQCGAGPGLGKNVNIGWMNQGMGDGDYMAAFQRIVLPIAQEFDPDLVIVSAGFDAAAGDDLGGCYVTPACYSHMTHMLMSLANGKVVVCLEGGYNLRAISRSALAVAKTLMGEPPERMKIPSLQTEAAHVLNEVRLQQAPYWECMRQGLQTTTREVKHQGGESMDIVQRRAQRMILSQEFNMVTLYVQRTALSKTFEGQVLATPGLYNAKKIVVIIHDPPHIVANADPISGTVTPENAYMIDPILPYIRRFHALGFGILDINIPAHMLPDNSPSNSPEYLLKPSSGQLEATTKELLCYLWDNYLEGYASENIVLMGVGDAYLGVKMLLTSRDCKAKIPAILSFVSGSLRPVKSETDVLLSGWYKNNSRIYVSPDHACWFDAALSSKVAKRRFGDVRKGSVKGVGKMCEYYLDEATQYINIKVAARLTDSDDTEEDDLMALGPKTSFGSAPYGV